MLCTRQPCSISDGPRHPEEDCEYQTPLEEEELAILSEELIDAMDSGDEESAEELREAIKDMFSLKEDEYGFWI